MDISSLYNISSAAVRQTAENSQINKQTSEKTDTFDSIIQKSV